MKFRAGDLVKLGALSADKEPLFAAIESASTSSHLCKNDVALIISLSHYDGRAAYIIGPTGCGWTFGAFLVKI